MAKQPLAFQLNRDHGGTDNGTHAHPMSARLGSVAHHPAPLLVDINASVLCVGTQRRPACRDQIQALLPVLRFHLAEGKRALQHLDHLVRLKPIAHRKGAQPLHQDVPREHQWILGLDFTVGDGLAQRHSLEQFKAVRGNEMRGAGFSRTVSAPPCALDHA